MTPTRATVDERLKRAHGTKAPRAWGDAPERLKRAHGTKAPRAWGDAPERLKRTHGTKAPRAWGDAPERLKRAPGTTSSQTLVWDVPRHSRRATPGAPRVWGDAPGVNLHRSGLDPRACGRKRHHVGAVAAEIDGDKPGSQRRLERCPALHAPAQGELGADALDRLEIGWHADQHRRAGAHVELLPDGLTVAAHAQHHHGIPRREGLCATQPPLGLEPIRRQSAVELVLHRPVMVPIVEARDAAEAVQIDIGVTRLQWVESPGHQ